eukprot:1280358-Amphidinium_carterae.1
MPTITLTLCANSGQNNPLDPSREWPLLNLYRYSLLRPTAQFAVVLWVAKQPFCMDCATNYESPLWRAPLLWRFDTQMCNPTHRTTTLENLQAGHRMGRGLS